MPYRAPMTFIQRAAAIASAALCAVVLSVPQARADEPQAAYVGAQACAGCHAAQAAAWGRSHHALAMQPATAQTVLGDFNAARFDHDGVTTTFSPRRRHVPGADRRTGRRAARLSGRLHVRRRSAAAIPDRLPRRPLSGARHRLGHRARRSRAGSAGSPSIPARDSPPATACTGPGATRPGTTSARSATRPICGRTSIWRPTPTPPPGPT